MADCIKINGRMFYPEHEAQEILRLHTAGFLEAVHISDESILKMSVDDMLETLYHECAFVLTNRFVEGVYTMREYYLVRSRLSDLLYCMARRAYAAESEG